MSIKAEIQPSSVFIVSGGAKGITAKCTINLAQKHPCKFILLGRSELINNEPDFARECFDEATLKKKIMEYLISQGEKPTPMKVQGIYRQIAGSREIKQTLSEIRTTGSEVEYLSVDVTDTLDLHQKISDAVEKMGKVTGIIHGAGNLADKLIEKKTEQDFDKVYTAKVKGLENLLSCVNSSELEHLVLFSSVSGFYGNIGQSDYAIANEILNKSAHLVKQEYPGCHVVAINWGAWDSGMVTPHLKKEFAKRGIDIIPIEVGTQMLVNELQPQYHNTTQLVIGSPSIPPATTLEPELNKYTIRRQLKLSANPFLHDHIIAGNPVLPATCAVSWISDSCEKIYPGHKAFSCTEFRVLKGITFNETLASEYFLDLQEVGKDVDNHVVDFQGKIWSRNPQGKTIYHFSANVKLLKDIPTPPTYERLNLNLDNIITTTGKEFYQQGVSSLFHGPAFQQVKRVININQEKITTECFWQEISKQTQGQFPAYWVNGFTTDLSTHGLWLWLSHFHQEICLPGQLSRYEQFAKIPYNTHFYVSCEVTNKTTTGVAADFYIHDEKGKLYSQLLGAKGIIFPAKLMEVK
ncbi:omega-3 polyunsaturated fatty acid synthase subunit, PfaA [Richelia intracellularis]|nr:omega-3 polyunsaturated fatty acid synthase subunit, PfaA [Richelia intracellularis]